MNPLSILADNHRRLWHQVQGSNQPSFAALAHFQTDKLVVLLQHTIPISICQQSCCDQRLNKEHILLDLTKSSTTSTYNGSPTFWLAAFAAEASGARADSTMYVNAFWNSLLAYADTHRVVAWFVGYVYDLTPSQQGVLELGNICHCAETQSSRMQLLLPCCTS